MQTQVVSTGLTSSPAVATADSGDVKQSPWRPGRVVDCRFVVTDAAAHAGVDIADPDWRVVTTTVTGDVRVEVRARGCWPSSPDLHTECVVDCDQQWHAKDPNFEGGPGGPVSVTGMVLASHPIVAVTMTSLSADRAVTAVLGPHPRLLGKPGSDPARRALTRSFGSRCSWVLIPLEAEAVKTGRAVEVLKDRVGAVGRVMDSLLALPQAVGTDEERAARRFEVDLRSESDLPVEEVRRWQYVFAPDVRGADGRWNRPDPEAVFRDGMSQGWLAHPALIETALSEGFGPDEALSWFAAHGGQRVRPAAPGGKRGATDFKTAMIHSAWYREAGWSSGQYALWRAASSSQDQTLPWFLVAPDVASVAVAAGVGFGEVAAMVRSGRCDVAALQALAGLRLTGSKKVPRRP